MLLKVLNLPPGSDVLDAGCGVAHVAIYMGRQGMRISGIDVVDHHIAKAQRNFVKSGLPLGQVTVQKMDYHNLESISNASKHGVYTMETFIHEAKTSSSQWCKEIQITSLFGYDYSLHVYSL
jgi:cyclopropane fatty-acyl-phospholipid synthase-like methyltransferase